MPGYFHPADGRLLTVEEAEGEGGGEEWDGLEEGE